MSLSGPLAELPHFAPDFVRWCSMHIVNLGLDLFVLGSGFRSLIDDTDTWGQGTEDERLMVAFKEFKSWAKENHISQLDYGQD